jgi:hypothetical protein
MEISRLLKNPTHTEYLTVLVAINIPFAYGITTKPGSVARYVAFILTVLPSYWIFQQAQSCFSSSMFYNGFFGSCATAYVMSATILLLIKRYQTNFTSAIQISPLYNPRLIGTSFQVKGVPKFPAYYGEVSKGKGPSRITFLLRQTSLFLWLYLLMDLVTSQAEQQTEEEREKLFGSGKEWEFHFTAEHIIFRIMYSLTAWYVGGRATLILFYTFFSIIGVGTGTSTPSQWPPFMGRLSEAYTVRRFWG